MVNRICVGGHFLRQPSRLDKKAMGSIQIKLLTIHCQFPDDYDLARGVAQM
jgi:hypothetical protein